MTNAPRDRHLQRCILGLSLGALLVSALVLAYGGSGTRIERVRVPVEPVSVPAGSRLGGTVTEVCVRPGEAVRKDQVLVRYDADLLRRQRASLASALEVVRSGMATTRLPEGARRTILDSHPDVSRAEERYLAALHTFEKQPNDAGARRALDQGAVERMRVRRRVGSLLGNAAKISDTVSLIEKRLSEIDRALIESEVRAPDNSVIDVLDVHPGERVLPSQPVVTLIRPGQYFSEFSIPSPGNPRLQGGTIGKGSVVGTGEVFDWRVETVTRRIIPPVLRERRDQAEELLVRVRFSASTPWVPGREAELQIP